MLTCTNVNKELLRYIFQYSLASLVHFPLVFQLHLFEILSEHNQGWSSLKHLFSDPEILEAFRTQRQPNLHLLRVLWYNELEIRIKWPQVLPGKPTVPWPTLISHLCHEHDLSVTLLKHFWDCITMFCQQRFTVMCWGMRWPPAYSNGLGSCAN